MEQALRSLVDVHLKVEMIVAVAVADRQADDIHHLDSWLNIAVPTGSSSEPVRVDVRGMNETSDRFVCRE